MIARRQCIMHSCITSHYPRSCWDLRGDSVSQASHNHFGWSSFSFLDPLPSPRLSRSRPRLTSDVTLSTRPIRPSARWLLQSHRPRHAGEVGSVKTFKVQSSVLHGISEICNRCVLEQRRRRVHHLDLSSNHSILHRLGTISIHTIYCQARSLLAGQVFSKNMISVSISCFQHTDKV